MIRSKLFSIFTPIEVACVFDEFCISLSNLLNVNMSTYLLNYLDEVESSGVRNSTNVFDKKFCDGIDKLKEHVYPKARNLTLARDLKNVNLGQSTMFEFLSNFTVVEGTSLLASSRIQEYPELKGMLHDILNKIPNLVARVDARSKEEFERFLLHCERLEDFVSYLNYQLQGIDVAEAMLGGVDQSWEHYTTVHRTASRYRTEGASIKEFYSFLSSLPDQGWTLTILNNAAKYWDLPTEFPSNERLAKVIKHNAGLFYSHKDVASSTQLGGLINRREDLQAFYKGILWDEYCRNPANGAFKSREILASAPKGLIHEEVHSYE